MYLKSSKDRKFDRCPKTGKVIKRKRKYRWPLWLFPIAGLLALIWFLIRVIPKPSRATYPCQRIAAPLASGFVVWLLGLTFSVAAFHRAKRLFHQSRYVVAAISIVAAVMVLWLSVSITNPKEASAGPFVPPDSPNTPVGIAKGINPGRVAWVYDPELVNWNGSDEFWWQDTHTDPDVAHSMMSRAIRSVAGIPNQADAWDAIFRDFNLTHHGVDQGYQPGDKIAIKVNLIFSRAYTWTNQTNRPSPQMVYALLYQLIEVASVPDSDITVYDGIFYIGDPIYDYCHGDFPGVTFAEGDATDRPGYEGGPGPNPGERIKVQCDFNDPNAVVHHAEPNIEDRNQVRLPDFVVDAKYFINFCLPRKHELAGITACAKNMFGSVHRPSYTNYHGWDPSNMHDYIGAFDFNIWEGRDYDTYNPTVELMGHEQMGGKTLLFLGECLHRYKWSPSPFNGRWPSSIFASQDGVAFESVLIDLLRSVGDLVEGTTDNYLHEAAEANDPPSETDYDPEGDGSLLSSLGVHEHWNNSTDKQYTRNLGTGDGIELIQLIIEGVTPGDFEPDGHVGYDDLLVMADHWLDEDEPGCIGDVTGDCKVNLDDFNVLAGNMSPQIPGDVEHDGDVDIDDLFALCGRWLETNEPGCIGDLTGECDVNLQDFAIVAKNWPGV